MGAENLSQELGFEIHPVAQPSGREYFYQLLTKTNEEGSIPRTLNFKEFSDYFSTIGFAQDVIVPGFLHLKKEQLKNCETGNAVNFFAEIAHGALLDRTSEAFEQSIDNILSLVAEHPLAETTKVEQRIFKWDNGRLRTKFGYMDAILDNAISSSQTLSFEVDRFKANKTNYDRLKDGRRNGNTDVFVEFSPSPPPSSETLSRGYLGNDCVFFYIYDKKNNQEIVVQRWLKAGKERFGELLSSLGREVGNNPSDIGIMQKGDFFDENEVNLIEDFIDNNNGSLLERRDAIDRYVQDDLRSFVEREVGKVLIEGAYKLINGQDITKESKELIHSLVYAQLKLRNKLADLTGLTTVAPVHMSSNQIQLLDSSREVRAQFMEQNKDKVVLSGCGVNVEDILSGGSSGNGAFGVNSNTWFSAPDTIMTADDFQCPECGHVLGKGERSSGECGKCGLTKQEQAKKMGVLECA